MRIVPGRGRHRVAAPDRQNRFVDQEGEPARGRRRKVIPLACSEEIRPGCIRAGPWRIL